MAKEKTRSGTLPAKFNVQLNGFKTQALGKTLDTIQTECPDQFVALWYQQGEPVMGRIWNDDGKVAAVFGWGGHEYSKYVGSIQVGNN